MGQTKPRRVSFLFIESKMPKPRHGRAIVGYGWDKDSKRKRGTGTSKEHKSGGVVLRPP